MLRRRLLLGLGCFAVAVVIAAGVSQRDKQQDEHNSADSSSSSSCGIFLAPSPEFGWGVYAARDFKTAELIEIVPAYLPLPSEGVEIQSSILYDYVHSSGCDGPNNNMNLDEEDDDGDYKGENDQLLIGHGSSYNHNDNPNIQFVEYTGQGSGHVMAVQAVRDIAMGEELLARYGDDDWFTSRSIPQKNTNHHHHRPSGADDPVVVLPAMDIPRYKSQYCSKIQAGIGSKTWNEKILTNATVHNFWFEADRRLPPKDTGFGVARAKVALATGDRIELSLGLLVSQRIMADSIVAPLLLGWKDLNPEQQRTMRMLRKNSKGQFILHYPGQSERRDSFESYEDLAILPIGALALVRRLLEGHKKSPGTTNCRLKINGSMQSGSTSLALELVATKTIKQGDVLLLDLPPAGTSKDLELLENELKRTGQPYHASTFAAFKAKDEL
jgi:hypothetical protein